MVDIVDFALTITQFHQRLDAGDDVFPTQGALSVFRVQSQTHVHFHPANGGQVIPLAVEKQRVEQGRCRFDGGRLTRAHDAVNVHERGFAVHVLVHRHGVAHVRTDGDVIDVENRDVGDTGFQQVHNRPTDQRAVLVVFQRQFIAGFNVDGAVFFVDDVFGNILARDVVKRHQQVGDRAFVDQFLNRAWRDLLASFGDDFAGVCVHQIIGRARTAHPFREERRDPAFVLAMSEADGAVIGVHHAFLVQAQSIQQRCHRQLAATVDTRIDHVLGVEFKVQPGSAIGDDPACKQQLARRMCLAFVMIKEHARRAVHLRDDHALGAVHNERSVRGHQGHVAHKDVLFLDVLDRLGPGVFIHIEHDQTQRDLQRSRVGHIALLAFLNIVFRLFQFVLHEFQNAGFVEILDRKNRLEHAHDAFAVRRDIGIAGAQEQVVG